MSLTKASYSMINGAPINVLDYGAVGDGVTNDTAAIQAAIDSGNSILFPNKTYLVTSLDFSSWSGIVQCLGTIKVPANTAITDIIDFSSASNFEWVGGTIDFNQTASTVEADPRADHGFYMLDARDGAIRDVTFTNIRVGEIIYINGTSSVSPSSSDGSKRIQVSGCSCVAFAPPSVDVGAAVYIRSDFYTSDGGGIYIAASNGLKQSDYTLDATVAYQRTTTDIQFSDCHFENFDGFRLFNAARVSCTNLQLINFYTRGYSLSPSCEDVSVTGGIISGNAAQINANFACKRCTFSGLTALGESAVVGQRHALRTGFGSTDIVFSNISGLGNDTRQVFVEGAQRVLFNGISLQNWPGGNTTVAISIAGGGAGNTSSWETKDIRFTNCNFTANYSVKIDDNAGTATIADGGVIFDSNCVLKNSLGFWNGSSSYSQILYSTSGTFTPSLIGATVAGTQTYSVQYGQYTLVNGLCTYKAHVTITAKDAAMAGDAEIGGLPFTSNATLNSDGVASVIASNVTLSAGNSQFVGWQKRARGRLTLAQTGSGIAFTAVQASNVAATTEIIVTGSYWI